MTYAIEIKEEIERFIGQIGAFQRGELDDEKFRPIRLRMGVYGQRQAGFQMIRVKVPYGGLNPEQLHRLAQIAHRYGNGLGHITTRQDLQFHFIPLNRVPEVLWKLAEVGLTTREACGNTVRNVTACPLSGVSPDEAFDVTPYAAAVSRHFLRKDYTQDLPRKFKIALDACAEGGRHVGAAFHDIAAIGRVRDRRRGFTLHVGGGLGNTPRPATVFEEFAPEEDLLWIMEAIVRVFNRDGERKNRNRARIKFLVEKIGWDEFVLRVRAMQASIERPRLVLPPVEEKEPIVLSFPTPEPATPEYAAWRRENVLAQRQTGFSAVQVLVPIGDLTVAQLNALAKISAVYAEGRVRMTRAQNVLFRWVKNENVPAVHEKLVEIALAEGGAERINDVTSCPGADTCNLGITSSKGLARAIREIVRAPEFAPAGGMSVKISGCPNSCGQHHTADIGFFGTNKRVGERDIPSYQLLVGGSPDGGQEYGIAIGRIPAKNAPAAFRAIVERFVAGREGAERFYDFVRRIGKDEMAQVVRPFENVAGADAGVDWGQTAAFAAPGKMKGECSA